MACAPCAALNPAETAFCRMCGTPLGPVGTFDRPCPLCPTRYTDPAEYSAHLAAAHPAKPSASGPEPAAPETAGAGATPVASLAVDSTADAQPPPEGTRSVPDISARTQGHSPDCLCPYCSRSHTSEGGFRSWLRESPTAPRGVADSLDTQPEPPTDGKVPALADRTPGSGNGVRIGMVAGFLGLVLAGLVGFGVGHSSSDDDGSRTTSYSSRSSSSNGSSSRTSSTSSSSRTRECTEWRTNYRTVPGRAYQTPYGQSMAPSTQVPIGQTCVRWEYR